MIRRPSPSVLRLRIRQRGIRLEVGDEAGDMLCSCCRLVSVASSCARVGMNPDLPTQGRNLFAPYFSDKAAPR